MTNDPILIEDSDGLNVVTTLDEARTQIQLLNADKNILKKQLAAYKTELGEVYNRLYALRQMVLEGFQLVFDQRKQR